MEDERDDKRLNLRECDDLFARLFPEGPASDEVVTELAPDSWERSELLRAYHPTPEILFEESTRMHNNIESLFKNRKPDDEPSPPAPTMAEIVQSFEETPADVEKECREIVGKCLWDIFSDNHDVIAPDGRTADIGSFRGAGDFISRWFNGRLDDRSYDYMDFYMGTVWIASRADMSVVYRMIFRRLKALGCDWHYSYPRIGVVRFGIPENATPADAGYDPSVALEKEQAEAKRQKEFEEMQESLRASYNESVEESRKLPPPEIVKSYMSVYGRKPQGWPAIVDQA